MISSAVEVARRYLSSTISGIDLSRFVADDALARTRGMVQGKVRDIVDLDDRLLITTTDRISAFDRVLTTIPCKGEVLNRISLFWFEATKDTVPNHLIQSVTPRSVLVRKYSVLPVEVVVRGYLTGSAWRDYQRDQSISGIRLPAGMRFNQRFDEPIITPATKAERGTHDETISREQVIRLVPEDLWATVEQRARALYETGRRIAASRGLILVDTKYEFGTADGELAVVDEMHTPDSSRYWFADSYEELYTKGERQRKLDKEYLRQWLMDRGFVGNGEPPQIPDDIRLEVAGRYMDAYTTITGTRFEPTAGNEREEAEAVAQHLRQFAS